MTYGFRLLSLAVAIGCLAPALLAAQSVGSVPSAPRRFEIDPVHSRVQFKVRHLGVSTVIGHFNVFSGAIDYDAARPSGSAVAVSIDAASLDTDNERRDADLKGANYLAVDSFPMITFRSLRVEPREDGRLLLEGDLTIKRTTRRVSLDARMSGVITASSGLQLMGVTASGRISRRDFGITFNRLIEGIDVVGDEVRIEIEVEARSRPPQ